MAVTNRPLSLERASWMVNSLSCYVRCVRLFLCGKTAQMKLLPVYLDASTPRKDAARICRDTENASRLIGERRFPSVLSVLFERYRPKILPTVIRAITIDVVSLFARKLPSHVEKSETVRYVEPAAYSNADVAIRVDATGYRANRTARRKACEPNKNACFWIVAKNLSESFRCDLSAHRSQLWL